MNRERGRRAAAWAALACGVVLAGCGHAEQAFQKGKTKITGAVSVDGYMGVAFVPIVDGKADNTAKRSNWGLVDGRYEAWMPPGKYAVHLSGADGSGPKVGEIEVGAAPVTFDVLTPPKKGR